MVIGGLAEVVEKERDGTACVEPEVINSELLRRKSSATGQDLKALQKLPDPKESFKIRRVNCNPI